MSSKLRILVITALYPPHHLGGYELRCKDVVERLQARGHQVQIITSMYGVGRPQVEGNIARILHLEPSNSLWQRIRWDTKDLQFIARIIKGFRPDVIHLWHMAQLARTIFPFLAKQHHMPIVYDEGGNGLSLAWHGHGRWIGFCESLSKYVIKSILKRILCRLVSYATGGVLPYRWAWPTSMIVYFNSQQSLDAARRAGVPLREAQIVYPGIDTDLFAYEPRSGLSNPLRLLMPGRIVPIKGVHDGIAALARLRRLLPEVAVYLDIVGPATDPAYLEDLRTQIRSYQLSDKVAFRHQLTATEMAVLYRFSDICLFLSHQPFGLSRIPLEAMASGSVVIATGNEGSSELLSNGQTGFLVPSGDPLAVADTVATLYDRPEQFVRVSAQARREVEEKYSIEQTVLHIEQILEQAALTRSSRA